MTVVNESSLPSEGSVKRELSESRRAECMKLLELHNTNRIDYNNRKWETIKFFYALFAALLGGAVAGVVALSKDGKLEHWLPATMLACLALTAAATSRVAVSNLKRESRLLFIEEAQVFKLAKYLELDAEIPEGQQWFPSDAHLLSPKWREWTYRLFDAPSTEPLDLWSEKRVAPHRFEHIFRGLFLFGGIVALVIAVLLLLVAVGLISMQNKALPDKRSAIAAGALILVVTYSASSGDGARHTPAVRAISQFALSALWFTFITALFSYGSGDWLFPSVSLVVFALCASAASAAWVSLSG